MPKARAAQTAYKQTDTATKEMAAVGFTFAISVSMPTANPRPRG